MTDSSLTEQPQAVKRASRRTLLLAVALAIQGLLALATILGGKPDLLIMVFPFNFGELRITR